MNNFVEFHDGASQTAPLLGKFCGLTAPTGFITTDHVMFVVFKTDGKLKRPDFNVSFVESKN